MSIKLVLEILLSYNGVASTKTISDKAKELYPNTTLWQYAHNRLGKLRRRGIVTFTENRQRKRTWSIVKDKQVEIDNILYAPERIVKTPSGEGKTKTKSKAVATEKKPYVPAMAPHMVKTRDILNQLRLGDIKHGEVLQSCGCAWWLSEHHWLQLRTCLRNH